MGVRVTTSGDRPRVRLTIDDVRLLAQASMSQVVTRVHQRGLDVHDRQFADYSTSPLKLYKRSSTGRALAPKGGESFPWVRGPKQRDGSYDATRIGQEAGRYYERGYRQYKAHSRRGLVNREGASGVEVDLVLSGALARSYRVTSVTSRSFRVGITGSARQYAGAVDGRRPFMGQSPLDSAEIERVLVDLMEGRA